MLLLAATILLISGGLFVSAYTLHSYAPVRSDFLQDYEAAVALRRGTSIYDPDFTKQNNHPPFAALVFVPLSFFSPPMAFWLWGILTLLLYVWLLWRVSKTLELTLNIPNTLLILGVALIWHPFISHLALGQISIAVAACIIGAWHLLDKDHAEFAGLLLGFAAAFKLYPALLGLYLLLRGHYKTFGVMVASAAIFSLYPLLFVAPQDYVLYITETIGSNAELFLGFPANISLASLIWRLFMENPWVQPLWVLPEVVRWLMIGTNVVCVAILAWQLHRFPRTTFGNNVAWSCVCVAMLLLPPISWQHAFPLLILPLGVLWYAYQQQPSRWLYLGGLAIFIAFSLPDFSLGRFFMAWSAPYRMWWFLGLVMALPTFALLLLWGFLHQVAINSDLLRERK